MYSASLPANKTYALPLLPALAVRPHRCENALGSEGGSNWITTSTWGRSRPLAATSVASNIAGEVGVATEVEKAANVRVRAEGGR